MMSGVPLEKCWTFNILWNNKFYYEAACCCYFYWVIYDARIHEFQIYWYFVNYWNQTVISQWKWTPNVPWFWIPCRFYRSPLNRNIENRLCIEYSRRVLTGGFSILVIGWEGWWYLVIVNYYNVIKSHSVTYCCESGNEPLDYMKGR
jgi:hypothetical protein